MGVTCSSVVVSSEMRAPVSPAGVSVASALRNSLRNVARLNWYMWFSRRRSRMRKKMSEPRCATGAYTLRWLSSEPCPAAQPIAGNER